MHDLVEQELETFKPHSGAQTIFEDLEYDGRLHQTIDDTVAYMSYQELREVFGSDYAHELELPEWVEVNDDESRSLIKLTVGIVWSIGKCGARMDIRDTRTHWNC